MMPNIRYEYTTKGDVLIFRPEGEFTNDNTGPIFDNILSDIMKNGIFNVIFNMGNIDTINSRVAGGFAGIYEKIDILGGNLFITDMNDFVDDTLDLLGMYLFLNKAKDEKEALQKLTV